MVEVLRGEPFDEVLQRRVFAPAGMRHTGSVPCTAADADIARGYATVDGQTTAHYIAEALEGSGATVSTLAQGVPIGGELDYLDDGTIGAALRARRQI